MTPRRRFSGGVRVVVAPPERERRKMLDATRNCWKPLEPAGTAEDPPLRTLRCRPRAQLCLGDS
eukprot:6560573-Alexandrium_andersonii.AAC.1